MNITIQISISQGQSVIIWKIKAESGPVSGWRLGSAGFEGRQTLIVIVEFEFVLA